MIRIRRRNFRRADLGRADFRRTNFRRINLRWFNFGLNTSWWFNLRAIQVWSFLRRFMSRFRCLAVIQ
ncbi:MAG: hypothetical protein B7Y73_05710 [Acidocella sp. 35-58-6]|nr:MAG: hypothetical protein B7Y73_05710 [Acidocella sp. 35-58-6]